MCPFPSIAPVDSPSRALNPPSVYVHWLHMHACKSFGPLVDLSLFSPLSFAFPLRFDASLSLDMFLFIS